MTDPVPDTGLSAADRQALRDLRGKKEWIEVALADGTVPPHVRGRMLTEYRQYVSKIHEIEGKRPVASKPSFVDELRERRAERLRKAREEYGT